MDSLKAGVTTVRDVVTLTPPFRWDDQPWNYPDHNILPAAEAPSGFLRTLPDDWLSSQIQAQLIDRIKRLKGYDIEMSIPPDPLGKNHGERRAAESGRCRSVCVFAEELETLVYEAHRLNM